MGKVKVVESVDRIVVIAARRERGLAKSGVVAQSPVRVVEHLVSALQREVPQAAMRWLAPIVTVTRLEAQGRVSEDVDAADLLQTVFGGLSANTVFTVQDRWPATSFVHVEVAVPGAPTRVMRLSIVQRAVAGVRLG